MLIKKFEKMSPAMLDTFNEYQGDMGKQEQTKTKLKCSKCELRKMRNVTRGLKRKGQSVRTNGRAHWVVYVDRMS